MSDQHLLHHLFPEGIYLIPETENQKPQRSQPNGDPGSAPAKPRDISSAEAQDLSSAGNTSSSKTQETAPAGTGNITQEPEAARVPEFAGQNRRNVLVMFDSAQALPTQQEQFLARVLGAVHLDMQDIALVRYADCRENWTNIPADKLLLFGCDTLAVQLPDFYQPSSLGNQTILRCAPLGVIMADKQHKTQLWQALKQMFDV